MQHDPEHLPASAVANPTDRGFVERMPPGAERDAVITSLARYRKPEVLTTGDPLPPVTVRRASDLAPVSLPEIHDRRPLLLAFGSFT